MTPELLHSLRRGKGGGSVLEGARVFTLSVSVAVSLALTGCNVGGAEQPKQPIEQVYNNTNMAQEQVSNLSPERKKELESKLLSPEAVEALKKTEDGLDQLRLQVKILNELGYGDKIKSSYNCPKEIDDDELEFGSCQSVVAGALYRRRADKTQEEIDEMNKKAYDHLITNL